MLYRRVQKIHGTDNVNSSWCISFSQNRLVNEALGGVNSLVHSSERFQVPTLTLLRPSVMLTSAEISACFYKKKKKKRCNHQCAPRRSPCNSFLFGVKSQTICVTTTTHLSVQLLDEGHIS